MLHRDFLPWRFSVAGRISASIASSCRRPKTCTLTCTLSDIPSPALCLRARLVTPMRPGSPTCSSVCGDKALQPNDRLLSSLASPQHRTAQHCRSHTTGFAGQTCGAAISGGLCELAQDVAMTLWCASVDANDAMKFANSEMIWDRSGGSLAGRGVLTGGSLISVPPFPSSKRLKFASV